MKAKNIYSMLAVLTASMAVSGNVFATDMSSANYSVKWDVTDGGGGKSSSTNYIVEASSGQPTAIGESSSTHYKVVAGFESIPDSDADKILDAMDNCTKVANLDQRDTDGDGFGNICDPDFDGNKIVNAGDLAYMKSKFFTNDPDADLDGNGIVNAGDLARLKSFFFKAPGPSGLAP
jgi:hypothetical protein